MSIDKSTLDQLKIDRSRSRREGPWGKIALVVVIAALAALGYFFWKNHKNAAVVRTSTAVEVSASSAQTVLNASGYVTARRQATVSSKVMGQITEVLFEEGQKVEQGQILARVDPSNINTSLRLAESQVEMARVTLNETKVQLEQAGRDLKRVMALATNQVATDAEVEKAQSDLDTLKARLERQQADITVAQKQVANWAQQLEDTIIRAPFTGIVVSKTAQPGEIISPMSAGGAFTRTGICTIVDMTSLEVEVDVNENYLNRVQAGQPVEAVLDAYVDWKIPAKVTAIIPTADRQKSTVKVRVGFDKLDPRILPDMGVKVGFLTPAGSPTPVGGVTVPKSAIHNDNGQNVVFLMKNDRVERHSIKTGMTNEEEVMVFSGVAAGEKVVVDGPSDLKDGDPVKEKQ